MAQGINAFREAAGPQNAETGKPAVRDWENWAPAMYNNGRVFIYPISKVLGVSPQQVMDAITAFNRAHTLDPVINQNPTLSEREEKVMVLLAQGCKTSEIAKKVFASIASIRRDIDDIMSKTGLKDKKNLQAYANDYCARHHSRSTNGAPTETLPTAPEATRI